MSLYGGVSHGVPQDDLISTHVRDLSPIKLESLGLNNTPIADLSPVKILKKTRSTQDRPHHDS